jgi:hypothetical protein
LSLPGTVQWETAVYDQLGYLPQVKLQYQTQVRLFPGRLDNVCHNRQINRLILQHFSMLDLWNEKIFYPPEKLNTTDTPQADAQVGTLAYYAPWGNVVMFYGNFGSAPGLYALGHAISGSAHIREMSGKIQIEK